MESYDINQRNHSSTTLMWDSRDGHEQVVEILLVGNCFNSDKQDKGSQTAQDGCRKCLHGVR